FLTKLRLELLNWIAAVSTVFQATSRNGRNEKPKCSMRNGSRMPVLTSSWLRKKSGSVRALRHGAHEMKAGSAVCRNFAGNEQPGASDPAMCGWQWQKATAPASLWRNLRT